MEYIFLSPPFPVKPFKEMSKDEASTHFNWYTTEIPERIESLKNAYQINSGNDKKALDFSPESLVSLWKWYISKVEILGKSESELNNEKTNYPEWVWPNLSKQKISIGWRAIAMDIAIYFAECFIKKHDKVKWGIITTPKTLAYVNKPVLTGFKANIILDPNLLLNNLTLKITKGDKNPKALLELFNIWGKYLEGV